MKKHGENKPGLGRNQLSSKLANLTKVNDVTTDINLQNVTTEKEKGNDVTTDINLDDVTTDINLQDVAIEKETKE